MISEQQLASYAFTHKNAIFITGKADLDFLTAYANSSLRDACLLPLNFDALGAILRSGHKNFRSHLPSVDFDRCKEAYRHAERQSRTWLNELGLLFEIDGVDVANLDAPNQFLLFTQASYIESLATGIMRTSPTIDTFYILAQQDPLPLDLYFDADTAAAILKFVCYRERRHWQEIHISHRTYKFPQYPYRPFLGGDFEPAVTHAHPLAARAIHRIGFCPSAAIDYQAITEELRALPYDIALVNSSWGLPIIHLAEPHDLLFDLTSFAQPADPALQAQLMSIWTALRSTRSRSSLADVVIRNPYLDFQLEYVITTRWLRLALLIRAATRLSTTLPLDLFICCELCHDEAAILANVYRRAGVGILKVPHSGWPSDTNWTEWAPTDNAITHTRSAANRLKQLAPGSRVSVVGEARPRKYRSLLHRPNPIELADRRALAIGRRIVVLLTNALELLGVPFVSPSDHIRSMSLLSTPPVGIASKVLVAVRTKPGVFTEDPLLYSTLASYSEESLSFLSDLTFSQSIELADCVVGLNLPTSGYYEVLQRGVPLIHVQLADVTTKHPDLPESVVPHVRIPEQLWPTVEAVLFDPEVRTQVLFRQQRFICADLAPTVEGCGNPLGAVLRNIVTGCSEERTIHYAACRTPIHSDQEATLASLLSRMSLGRGAGHVDDVLAAGEEMAFVHGWAADLVLKGPAARVYIVTGDTSVAIAPTLLPRPDVAEALKDRRLTYCGFSAAVPLALLNHAQFSVYAELHDGSVHEIARNLSISSS